MKGKWKGEYWFTEKAPEVLLNRKTKFEIEINNSNDSTFFGIVNDDIKTGGTKGTGIVTGKIKGNNISFIKQMPIKTMVFPDGEKIEQEKPHRPIYYNGIINTEKKEIIGTWRFKKGFSFVKGGIAFFRKTKGKWKMKKVD